MKRLTQRRKREKARERRLLRHARTTAFIERGLVYNDLARLAHVSYSMAVKWMQGLRTSKECQRAFDQLTAEEKAS